MHRSSFSWFLVSVCLFDLAAGFVVTIRHDARLHRYAIITRGRATQRCMSSTQVDSSSPVENKQQQQQQQQQQEILKSKLIQWGKRTDRGFTANSSDKKEARKIIFELAKYNPTKEPARAYYNETNAASDKDDAVSTSKSSNNNKTSTIQGKWTLIFTDAPDITGLQTNNNPLVELGRIGQDCQPPTIANVIEWKAPKWIDANPFVPSFLKGQPRMEGVASSDTKKNDRLNDNGRPRVLQKVLTKGKATPSNPSLVKLDIAGLQVTTPSNSSSNNNDMPKSNTLQQAIAEKGLIAGLVEQWPLDLQGQSLPFGEFEILYLDDTMRITRTGQNYIAANVRITSPEEEWF